MSRAGASSTQLRDLLLAFYDAHARELPWRGTRDPFAIWVSEVMLQQTRVQTVVRYYEPFLARFPNVRALADASEDEVLSAWTGLGYYRRARLLHRAVREVVARYGGVVPKQPEARRALPGVGRYTAGAIGSIAFELPEPIVDGNVARVFARVHAIDTPLGRAQTEARLWQLAEQLCKGPRPGALNQALMELGATLCSKHVPRCEACPIRVHCRARALGRQGELPIARKKPPPREVALVALIAHDPKTCGILLARGEGTLFGGLWNLPMREGRGRKAAQALARQLGLSATLGASASGCIEHVLTHRRLRVVVFAARLRTRPKASATQRLVARTDLSALGTSALTRKALALQLTRDIAARPRK